MSESDPSIVFISNLLPHQHREVVEVLRASLGECLRVIPGTKDIWCRDFMPIQLAPDRFVQFRYDPDYLKDHPQLRTRDGASLLGLKHCEYSDLVVDGGNIVRWRDTAILTEKVFKENPSIPRPDVRRQLERALEIDKLIAIPVEPGDPIGHSDGMVRFVDGNTVLVNDYRKIDPAFGEQLGKALRGFEIIPFPYCPTDEPGPDPEIPPALGVYINFLQIDGMIFCPIFGKPEDDEALERLSRCFPKSKIMSVPCCELALGGGVLNCVTWSVCAMEVA